MVPPRSDLRSDCATLRLCGRWQFRWHPEADAPLPGDCDDTPDDDGWESIDVPSHWVLQGDGRWGRPAYTNVRYPFPLDPPHVPDENPTGDYRRTFEVPAQMLSPGRLWLRFDGVESLGLVRLNGVEVGIVRGSRTRNALDVTGLVRPGPNTLDVRVHQWSAMTYVEDQDQWWLPGIFREVTLLHRPTDGLDDVWLQADRDPETGQGTIRVELRCTDNAYPVDLACPELGLLVRVDSPTAPHQIPVGPVEPWSADVPRLYDVRVSNAVETISLRTGFRRVEVVGDAWLVNGRRIRLRGVNRHDFHPELGRVFDTERVRSELQLMKRSNLNAIRTAHYPPHPGLLDLADELGFWVIDECDIETHGFEPAGWRDNPSDDPAWREVYLDRARRMVERDKNHPCVVAWSLGNESGAGVNLEAMAAWVRRRDPGRPIHYENDHEDLYVDIVSRMYAPVEELVRLTEVRDRPVILCEYLHAMGNGAGAVARYEEVFDAHPALHGGLVWEWSDHGILTTTQEGVPYYAYGGDFGEPVHDGSFVCDGMTLSDGTPTPMLAEVSAVMTPIKLVLDPGGVTVENRRHDGSTADLTFTWRHDVDGHLVDAGPLGVPPVEAGGSARVALPALGLEGPGEHRLEVCAALNVATAWAPEGHVLTRAQVGLGHAETRAAAPSTVPAVTTDQGLTLGAAEFDRAGRLTRLGDLTLAGGELSLWRAPTENDSHDVFGSYELAPPDQTGGFGAPGPSSAARWRAAGLDRLQSRLLSLEAGSRGLRTVRRLAAASATVFVLVEQRWTWAEGWLRLEVEVEPSTGWTCTWPRAGVHLRLPSGYAEVDWFGTGPTENYPDSRAAARVGRFSSAVDDMVVRYARPQESGHRADLRELTLTGPDLPQVRVRTEAIGGTRPGFVVSRHSAQETTGVGHPHELPVPAATHLYLDLAQHGLGSRACGPDVLPEHALWPRPLAATVLLQVG